ncbi:L-glyceraldehyde 3-phosphate reductase [mine drainage metagenome]|jgi:aryl-alcohol dehydrogenase-like predicted oxidoreductase|uniref:L-glyceraldehyde 3-phosphate reductase n=1 Tax=mine drainage metagenome TaxID=410659 RepID=A0A1J5QAJ6_9ZZZZ
MDRIQLGTLHVTPVCLGTMTFGEQNTEEQAHAQLDEALAQGVNFIDTAEMYPVPARAETSGRTESYVGSWLRRQRRDAIVLATKAAGPGRGMAWIRDGELGFDAPQLQRALDGSLRRLGTDYVDLYQLHWPDRNVPLFGQQLFDPSAERDSVPLARTLLAIGELIRSGRVRHWGLSNETPWGLMRCLQLADVLGVPRPLTVQNAYSLLNRSWETGGLAEVGWREGVGLLAYSPLGFGVLSGKYLDDPNAVGRINLFGGFGQRYAKPNVEQAVAEYAALARRHGLTPTQLALGFTASQWCVGATIIGATSVQQLRENLDAMRLRLSPELRAEIDAIHQRWPNPAP